MQQRRSAAYITLSLLFLVAGPSATAAEKPNSRVQPRRPASRGEKKSPKSEPGPKLITVSTEEIDLLKKQLALQQEQIKKLQSELDEQKYRVDRALQPSQVSSPAVPTLGQVASLRPALPSAAAAPEAAATPTVVVAPTPGEEAKNYMKKVDQLEKTLGALNKGLAGFRLSGDVRLRSDNTFRSSNSVAGAAQNVRARYRVRLNVDKTLSENADTHIQLSSGPFNNGLTYDSDFNGTVTRGSILLSEAWGDYHPNKNFSIRGGKMSEVFADNARFLMDDDVRLNGFQQVIKQPFSKGVFEFRAGQYVFTNPNVQVLPSAATCAGANPPATCAYVAAGFPAGNKVPSTNLFDQGVVVTASPSENWTHQFTLNFELWRNPNSIQLASLASGFALLGNPYNGVTLSGAITGTGNATTTKGGAVYTAEDFHIGQIAYVLTYKGWKSHRQGFPVSLELHASKNFGADFYESALMGQISAGETKKFGDVAFKYGFFYKPANSMISQLTDDDVGTGTGVNLKTHMIRFDLGLNKFMAWQNLVFLQDELAGDDPARNFFVNAQRGAARQYRYQGQLQFTF